MADPEGDAVPIPERKFRAEVVKRWEKMQAWMAKKDAEDKRLFAMIKRFHPELGGVESAPGSSPCQRTVTPPPAPGKVDASTGSRLAVEGDDLVWRSKPIRVKGAGKWLKGSAYGLPMAILIALCLLLLLGGMRPIQGRYSVEPGTNTEYITAPGTAEAGAFVRAVRADEDSWWNLTDAQREIGEDAIAALGGE